MVTPMDMVDIATAMSPAEWVVATTAVTEWSNRIRVINVRTGTRLKKPTGFEMTTVTKVKLQTGAKADKEVLVTKLPRKYFTLAAFFQEGG